MPGMRRDSPAPRTLVTTVFAVEPAEFNKKSGAVSFRSWAAEKNFLSSCAPAAAAKSLQKGCKVYRCAHDFAVLTNDDDTLKVRAAKPCARAAHALLLVQHTPSSQAHHCPPSVARRTC